MNKNTSWVKIILAAMDNEEVDHFFDLGFLKNNDEVEKTLLNVKNGIKDQTFLETKKYQIIPKSIDYIRVEKMIEMIDAELNKKAEPLKEESINVGEHCFEVLLSFYQKSDFSFSLNMGVISSNLEKEEIKTMIESSLDLKKHNVELYLETLEITPNEKLIEKVNNIIF